MAEPGADSINRMVLYPLLGAAGWQRDSGRDIVCGHRAGNVDDDSLREIIDRFDRCDGNRNLAPNNKF